MGVRFAMVSKRQKTQQSTVERTVFVAAPMGEGVGGAKALWLNGCVASGRGVLLVAATISNERWTRSIEEER